MTLRRKMLVQILATAAGLLLLGGSALWSLRAVQRELGSAISGYRQLREVYETGAHIAMAGKLLKLDPPQRRAAMAELQRAAGRLELAWDELAAESAVNPVTTDSSIAAGGSPPPFRPTSPAGGTTSPAGGTTSPAGGATSPAFRETLPAFRETFPEARETFPEVRETFPEVRETFPEAREAFPEVRESVPGGGKSLAAGLKSALVEAQAGLWAVITEQPEADAGRVESAIDRGLRISAELASAIGRRIEASEADARQRDRWASAAVAGVGVLVIGAVAGLSLWQYRSVVRPLNALAENVRALARGELSRRIPPVGGGEFVALAADFNHMARELDELYHQLERKVAEASVELVRCERLASVGYLAAGVAHEVNNPLAIIAAQAELTAAALGKPNGGRRAGAAVGVDEEAGAGAGAGEGGLAEARRALGVIAEEAFRCKAIVGRLLELARPGAGAGDARDARNARARERVGLNALAREVVATVGALAEFAGRAVRLELAEGEEDQVAGQAGPLKQVALNLLVNALEASGVEQAVTVSVRRAGEWVELAVSDRGRGMDSATLGRVFEPFFTAKRGAGRPGTGLGLSISHAIVREHGGSLTAHSAGPSRGSRFVMRLAAWKGER